jgi:ribosomal RNA-processing protein 7
MSIPTSISGFTVLPVAYTSNVTHCLYVRAHSAPKHSKKGKEKAIEFPDGRTMFVVNVPPDATDRELVMLFRGAGTVESVVFDRDDPRDSLVPEEDGVDTDDEEEIQEDEDGQDSDDDMSGEPSQKRRRVDTSKSKKKGPPEITSLPVSNLRNLRLSGRTAHIIFLDAPSLSKALIPPKKSKPLPWPTSEEPTGLEHYIALHSSLRLPLDAVKTHADTYMLNFEWKQAQSLKRQESKYKAGEAIVDEDGFTLVTRGGAYGRTLGGGVGVASKKFETEMDEGGVGDAGVLGRRKKGRRGKEKKEKEGFYGFQKAEKQRQRAFSCSRFYVLVLTKMLQILSI